MGGIRMNPIETITNWIEVNRDLKNVTNRLNIYPNDVKLRQEKEILEDKVKELKVKVDRIRGNNHDNTNR
jgi:hypothetical protein